MNDPKIMKPDEKWDAVEEGVAKYKRIQEGLEPSFNYKEHMHLYMVLISDDRVVTLGVEMNDPKVMKPDEGWDAVEKGVAKYKRIQDGLEPPFNSEEYMQLYTLQDEFSVPLHRKLSNLRTIFNMCLRKDKQQCLQQLYDGYKQLLEDYINSMVLPSLREKDDESLLRDLVTGWSKYKVFGRWISRLFNFLDRYYACPRSLSSLDGIALACFHDMVYQDISRKAKDAVVASIEVEREGGQIDRALLKNVLEIYVEIGMGKMDLYEKDFETYMLGATAAYYSRKASESQYSHQDYNLKVKKFLKEENDRVAHYLHPSSAQKLLELLEETSKCGALLEDKIDVGSGGVQIDGALLKDASDPRVELGKGKLDSDGEGFVTDMLEETAVYNRRNPSRLIPLSEKNKLKVKLRIFDFSLQFDVESFVTGKGKWAHLLRRKKTDMI
ncbi:hypothetical protein Cgig2_002331 [Carnegiea gigantea]|uniref:Cullin N-terminal domain-containing protein n=1 Tax=Carnegiea gigantea TaxID=171969 RepID=A0A9Q1JZE4_9CARY|nr:hypothetical protein Cgig2_002331 [Carnegiea gigantea]